MFSFDGTTFKNEPSSEYPHRYVLDLGSYKGSPFVTGSSSTTNGIKTEILDYGAGEWNGAADYPFSTENNRYLTDTIASPRAYSIGLYYGPKSKDHKAMPRGPLTQN